MQDVAHRWSRALGIGLAALLGVWTSGAAAQQAAAGARAVGITVGTRYIHTVTEMLDRRDLKAAYNIIAAYLADVQ